MSFSSGNKGVGFLCNYLCVHRCLEGDTEIYAIASVLFCLRGMPVIHVANCKKDSKKAASETSTQPFMTFDMND